MLPVISSSVKMCFLGRQMRAIKYMIGFILEIDFANSRKECYITPEEFLFKGSACTSTGNT